MFLGVYQNLYKEEYEVYQVNEKITCVQIGGHGAVFNDFGTVESMQYAVNAKQFILIDEFNDLVIVNQTKCNCDLLTVIMRSGCQCNGI